MAPLDKEYAMVIIMTLLGSMIVCETLFPGALQRACTPAVRELQRQQIRVSSLIEASAAHTTGRDYRWE